MNLLVNLKKKMIGCHLIIRFGITTGHILKFKNICKYNYE